MKPLLTRLARTSPAELRFRVREKLFVAAEALRFAKGDPWKREALDSLLVGTSRDLHEARLGLRSGDWRRAGAALRRHFASRAPRFQIDPARRSAIVATIQRRFPRALEESVERAERLLARRYDLLGYRDLSFTRDSRLDWHFDPVLGRSAPNRFWTRVPYLDPANGDHKLIWEFNRHQHWLALARAAWLTGDRRYVAGIKDELASWLNANPPLTGINWSSMLELALRSLSWTWTVHLCAAFDDDDDPSWFIDLLVGLDRQLNHVARHLSFYFSPNTHLLGEALALYVGGRVFPELKSASRWERVGREILVHETSAQILPDGGHAERSAHYHRYALDFYMLALAVARKTGDPAAPYLEEAASRLATFCRALADDDGRLPAIGDDDGGLLFPICGRAPDAAADSLALAAALLGRPELAPGAAPEEVLWMLGGDEPVGVAHPAATIASQYFPHTGYAVIRSQSSHAVFDAGPHGYLNAGHAHADSLSLTLSVGRRRFLIDPGTATYTRDPELRDRFRSTAMHNTVVVDGKPQSIPAGPFHWISRANARLGQWRSGMGFDYAEAEHDGYAPLVHRRTVVRAPHGDDDFWLIADHLLGAGSHGADVYWHIDPDWVLETPDGPNIRFAHGDGTRAAIASTARARRDFRGDADGFGWCSPVYGKVVPAPTICVSTSADVPFSVVTAIAAGVPVQLAIESAEVGVERGDGWHRTAVAVKHNEDRLLAVLTTPSPGGGQEDSRQGRSLQRVASPDGELRTDGRLAILRLSASGEPVSLIVVDCTAAAWTGRGAFTVNAPSGSGDMHLSGSALRQLGSDAAVRLVG